MRKKYSVIIADPPWDYHNLRLRGTVEKQYPTMSIDEICALPVAQLAMPNAVLLLWTTWPQLQNAFRVIKSWDFKYVTGFPWIKITEVAVDLWGELNIKVPYGVGFWARGASEPLLIARRGKIGPPEDNFIGLLSPNLRHSRKPDDVYAYAESFPEPYLELFARRQRENWDAIGYEINGKDIKQILQDWTEE